ncbi:MAG TPA: ABC transporter substrate-binding protein [Ramlibacter sp.]|nr:ABC transporter substrate-binding protein [Ramlibacter sp.]
MTIRFRALAAVAAFATVVGAPAQAQEIPVAAILTLTGPTAFAGVPSNNGLRLAIEEANKSGFLGKARIKLIEGDYGGDKGQLISLANQAIKRDKVVLAFGPSTSVDAIAVAPVFNDNKTPMFSVPTLNAILDTGPWSFKFQQAQSVQLPLLGKYVIEKTPVRKVAIVYDRTNDGMIDAMKLFRDEYKAGGGAVTTEEAVVSNESNFVPLVTKIMAQDVDAIFFSTYAEQTANLMVQLRQAGLPSKVRFFGSISLASPRLVAIAGKAAEGTVLISDYVAGVDRNKAFEAAYKARYSVEADPWAAVGYSMGQVALRAIKDAGPNPDQQKVRDALMKVRDVPVPVGNGLWNHNERKPAYGVVMLQVKDGKFVPAP